MDMNNGNLHRVLDDESMESLFGKGRKMVPLTDAQYREASTIPKHKRSGWMRNQPCPCGSNIKFKKCCWYDEKVEDLDAASRTVSA